MESNNRICECKTCVRSRRWDKIIEDNKPNQEILGLINEIRNDLCDSEEDNSIMKCILKGNWPGVDKYIQVMQDGYAKFLENNS